MRGIIALAFLAVACVSALEEKEYQDSFTAWMQKYQKSYTATEFHNRYAIFKDNLDYVNKWNAKGNSHTLDTNHLADLTNEEYRSIYLGYKGKNNNARVAAPTHKTSTVGLPTSVDWRTSGAVTGVKNQGQCGSCWSFSTTGSTEGIHQISSGNLVSLSEQNLMDCSDKYGNQGCNGGLMDDAFQYIIANKGIDTEASYPYKGATGKCAFDKSNVGATLDGYQDVKTGDEAALQVAAAQQPVSVAIDASHTSFQLYSSGIYYEAACSTSALDHGVLVIGYGVSSNATDAANNEYWLVKNSWGTTWGLEGYIWMSRDRKNNCGIATSASYPTITSMVNTATTNHTHTAANTATHSTSGSSATHATSTSGYTSSLVLDSHKSAGGKGFDPSARQIEAFKF